jgi:type VI secretion system protein VasD
MRWSVLSLACIGLLVSCGSTAPLLQGSIMAAPTTNPDLRGRPSPIVVRVYELKSLAAFDSADFFSLFDKEAETLGSDLVGREEYDLRPAETRPYRRQLQPDTKFIGVVAAFRDLENSRWRQAAPVPKRGIPLAREVTLTIGIEARAVSVAVK